MFITRTVGTDCYREITKSANDDPTPSLMRHHIHRPRFSPTIRPAATRTLVWCEIVGWLFPTGASRSQLQISPALAIATKMRKRTGSPSAAHRTASASIRACDARAEANGNTPLDTAIEARGAMATPYVLTTINVSVCAARRRRSGRKVDWCQRPRHPSHTTTSHCASASSQSLSEHSSSGPLSSVQESRWRRCTPQGRLPTSMSASSSRCSVSSSSFPHLAPYRVLTSIRS